MNIRIEAPPADAPQGRGYKALFDASQAANGAWVAVDRDDIPGETAARKRAAIKAAATQSGLDVEVRFSEDSVYVRVKNADATDVEVPPNSLANFLTPSERQEFFELGRRGIALAQENEGKFTPGQESLFEWQWILIELATKRAMEADRRENA